ncbi:MAG: tetratricopeptide repeat protein [Myxococcota bacterium]|nr:tetratricopeptide repeat protein [Myxococcota bacterium]
MTKAEVQFDFGPDVQSQVFEKLALAFTLVRSDNVTEADRDAARTLLEEAIALDEERADTYYHVGLFYGNDLNDVASMYLYLARFVELASPRHVGWAEVNELLASRAWSTYIQNRVQPSSSPQLELAERYYLAAYDAILPTELRSKLAEFEFMLGLIAIRQRAPERALRYLRASAEHAPELRRDALILASSVLVQANQAADAVKLLDSLELEEGFEQSSEQLVSFTTAMATAHSANGAHQTALQYLQRAEQILNIQPGEISRLLAPELARIHDTKASVYLAQGDYASAESEHRKALSLDAKPGYRNNLAWSIALDSKMRDPRLDEALSLSREAVAAEPSAAYLYTLAEVLYRLERYDEAVECIDDALLLEPEDSYLLSQRQRFLDNRNGFSSKTGLQQLKTWTPPTYGHTL